MKIKFFLLLGWLICSFAWVSNAAKPDVLGRLRSEHPRLLLTDHDAAALRATAATNSQIALIINYSVTNARSLLTTTTLDYKKEGNRLLIVSREALRRIVLWSFAYRMTGDKAFLERAEREMLTLAAFNDWNPSHFLDTAEMTSAMAIGYDWLFSELSPATRAAVRQAILEKGLKPALDPKARWNDWQKTQNNWNQVCFGSLTLGALAIAESEPTCARQLLERARTGNLNGMQPYAPDGVYPEGPIYWAYGTTYEVLMISALQTALGTDWSLPACPGFLASAVALNEQTGPTGRPFNFSDGRDSVAFNPTLFWFAQRLHQPGLVYFQNQLLKQRIESWQKDKETDRFFPFLAIWASGLPLEIPPPTLPLAWHGDGANPVGVFRSSWTDSNALFLAFKGGSAHVNHAHMDAGSFVLDADGVRWACDLGAQDYYSIESKGWALFNMKQNSDRWRFYRLNNFSHNTLTLGGKLHDVTGDARITEFTTNAATVDLSRVFAGQADRVTRHFVISQNRSVLIHDEIFGAKAGLSVHWQMVTYANIKVDKVLAQLHQNGRTLNARIISPAGAQFEIASAQPPDDGVNQRNPGAQILAVNVAVPDSGKAILEIQLEPAP
jgi:hypothetical protein